VRWTGKLLLQYNAQLISALCPEQHCTLALVLNLIYAMKKQGERLEKKYAKAQSCQMLSAFA